MRPIGPLMMLLALAACTESEPSSSNNIPEQASVTSPQARSPDAPATIDCARASGQAEQAVCADKELAALDRLAGPRDDSLKASRDACVRADELRPCLVEAYAIRIAERAKAGAADAALVVGPTTFRCGRDEIEATFINSEPDYAVLAGGDRQAVLPRATAASGVKYEGRVEGETWSFWNKGREATLVRGGAESRCAEQPNAG